MKVILTAHVVLALHPGALHHTVLNLAGLTLTTEAPASSERGGRRRRNFTDTSPLETRTAAI